MPFPVDGPSSYQTEAILPPNGSDPEQQDVVVIQLSNRCCKPRRAAWWYDRIAVIAWVGGGILMAIGLIADQRSTRSFLPMIIVGAGLFVIGFTMLRGAEHILPQEIFNQSRASRGHIFCDPIDLD